MKANSKEIDIVAVEVAAESEVAVAPVETVPFVQWVAFPEFLAFHVFWGAQGNVDSFFVEWVHRVGCFVAFI